MRLFPHQIIFGPGFPVTRRTINHQQFELEQQQTTQQKRHDGEKKAVKETFIEPDVKWKESKAKRLLYKDIVEGKVPPDATGADGQSTMQLSDIYLMHPEFAEYDYKKFSSRLSSLRASIVKEKTAKENENVFS
jgi:hypothetical protein